MSRTAEESFGDESDLGWMILVSVAVHAAAFALVVTLPYALPEPQPKLMSYTVDLVAPDRVGGTNIPGKVRVPPKPKVQAAPPPPPPKVAKAEKPKPPVEKEKEQAPKAAAKPKPQPKEKAAPVKVAAKKEKAPPPTVEKKAKAEAKKKAVAKPKAEKKEVAAAKAEPKKKDKAEAEPEPDLSPQRAREAIAASLREERLAAAVKRAQERLQESAAVGVGDGSAPTSIGPGEGSGGTLKGLDWIMYKNRVETTIRENWVWTGPDRTLETIVRFGITETGEIVDVRIERSSGDSSYDASVERAVKLVSPLPPPPEAYRDEFREYELTFNAEFLQM